MSLRKKKWRGIQEERSKQRAGKMRDKKNFTYEEAVEYVLQIPKFTKKNTPEDTRRFYEYLGRPGESSGLIHVAGTVPYAPISTPYWKRPVIPRAFSFPPISWMCVNASA